MHQKDFTMATMSAEQLKPHLSEDLSHIAIVAAAENKDNLIAAYEEMGFPLAPVERHEGQQVHFTFFVPQNFRVGKSVEIHSAPQIELIFSDGNKGVADFASKPENQKGAPHHLCWFLGDAVQGGAEAAFLLFEHALTPLRGSGLNFLGNAGPGAHGKATIFIHPKDTGVLTEFEGTFTAEERAAKTQGAQSDFAIVGATLVANNMAEARKSFEKLGKSPIAEPNDSDESFFVLTKGGVFVHVMSEKAYNDDVKPEQPVTLSADGKFKMKIMGVVFQTSSKAAFDRATGGTTDKRPIMLPDGTPYELHRATDHAQRTKLGFVAEFVYG